MNMLLLCLAALAWIAHTSCPANSYKILKEQFSCSLSFQTQGQKCGQTFFTSCTITSCTGSPQNCTSYKLTEPKTCLQYCCKSYDSSQDIYSAAKTCTTQASLSNTLLIAIIVTIAVGISLFIIFVMCIVYRKYKKAHKISLQNNIISEQISNPQAMNAQSIQQIRIRRQKLKTEVVKVNPLRLKYQWNQYHREELEDSHCTICLSGSSNLKLECGHWFHPKCLREWLKKKKECGVCRSQKLMNMVLICKECTKKQANITFDEFRDLKKQNLACQNCKDP